MLSRLGPRTRDATCLRHFSTHSDLAMLLPVALVGVCGTSGVFAMSPLDAGKPGIWVHHHHDEYDIRKAYTGFALVVPAFEYRIARAIWNSAILAACSPL